MKEKLGFGHLGNGVIVWDSNRIDPSNNDYLELAHINRCRNVKYYTDEISQEGKDKIERFAREENMGISYTQKDQSVFWEDVKNVEVYLKNCVNPESKETVTLVKIYQILKEGDRISVKPPRDLLYSYNKVLDGYIPFPAKIDNAKNIEERLREFFYIIKVIEEKNEIVYCRECGSTNIESRAWVIRNEFNNVSDYLGTDSDTVNNFCNDCKSYVWIREHDEFLNEINEAFSKETTLEVLGKVTGLNSEHYSNGNIFLEVVRKYWQGFTDEEKIKAWKKNRIILPLWEREF